MLDRQRGWEDSANASTRDTLIAVFLCPNNPDYNPPVRPSPTHYVGIAGVGGNAAELKRGDEDAGFFGEERVLRRSDVSAGISHTLMALETASDIGPWISAGFPTVRGVPEDVDHLVGVGAPFGGNHAGGMNALYVDGSVRFESDRIDPKILRDLARLVRE